MVPKCLHTTPNGRSYGVMVSTLDSESSDPSSNLGGALQWRASSRDKLLFASISRNIFNFIVLITLNKLNNWTVPLDPPQFTQNT